jgi:hypothetical protein
MRPDIYEIHITVRLEDGPKTAAVQKELKWKSSSILGDPVLGNDKPFYYLTKYAGTLELAMEELQAAVETLRLDRVSVVREKVEKIVYDMRY